MTHHKPTQPTNPTTKRCCGRGGNTCSQFKFQHATTNEQKKTLVCRSVPPAGPFGTVVSWLLLELCIYNDDDNTNTLYL